jgi:hypothetical protein
MRVFSAAAIVFVLTQPAFAQQERMQRYGEEDKEKTQSERQAERDRQRAYDKSLKNIPDKGPSDPWGTVRSNEAPKTQAPAAKPKKTATPQ